MSDLRYVLANLIDGSTITSTSEDSLFPLTNLCAGFPSRTFRFATAGTDDHITFDLGTERTLDFCSIHGHNIDSGVTSITVRTSTDNFSGSDTYQATITARDPAMYERFSAPARRYWRVKFAGTNGKPIEIGELVLGYTGTLTKNPRHDMQITETRAQIRNRTRAGELSIVNLTKFATKELILTFRGSYTALENVRDSLWAETNHGFDPCVIVPNDDRPEVHFGHFRHEMPISRLFANPTAAREVYDYELTFQESAFAVAIIESLSASKSESVGVSDSASASMS